jgi:hypothetical protein
MRRLLALLGVMLCAGCFTPGTPTAAMISPASASLSAHAASTPTPAFFGKLMKKASRVGKALSRR